MTTRQSVEVIVAPYRVVYRLAGTDVQIVTVFRASSVMPGLDEGRSGDFVRRDAEGRVLIDTRTAATRVVPEAMWGDALRAADSHDIRPILEFARS